MRWRSLIWLVGVVLMTIPLRADVRAVQFVVVVPDAAAHQPGQIYLACSRDRWKPDARVVPRIAPGIYAATFEFEPGLTVEYKFTREGTWDTVERSDDGHDVANHSLMVDAMLDEQVVLHRVATWANRTALGRRQVSISGQPLPPPPALRHTISGDVRYHYRVHAPQLKNDRTVMVYLPPGYDDRPDDRYPVLYMHDGNNVFDAATSFGGVEWQADEAAERLIAAGEIPPLIIVAVYNTPDRLHEYTPFPDKRLGGGRGDAYLDFLVQELKPLIDKTYRTKTGRDDTAICGSSLGGLISLYAAYRHPEVFGRAGVVSPSLWFANGRLIDFVRERKLEKHPRLWIDVGTAEGRDADDERSTAYVQGVRDLGETLRDLGLHPQRDFELRIVEGARHNETAWAERFPEILKFLFGAEGSGGAGERGSE